MLGIVAELLSWGRNCFSSVLLEPRALQSEPRNRWPGVATRLRRHPLQSFVVAEVEVLHDVGDTVDPHALESGRGAAVGIGERLTPVGGGQQL